MDGKRFIEEGWERLFDVTKKGRIGLFLCAGLSIPNRLPSWADLTAQVVRRLALEAA